MSSGIREARQLVAYRGHEPVLSLYLDLDPELFATPTARSSQIRSLLDTAAKEIESDNHDLNHEQRIGLRADLQRINAFLSSPEAPFKGARGVALFSSAGGRPVRDDQAGQAGAGAGRDRRRAVRRADARGGADTEMARRARQPPLGPGAGRIP